MEDIIIRIKGDPEDIDNLAKSLHKVQVVDNDNAKQFHKHNEEFKKQSKDKEQSLSGVQKGLSGLSSQLKDVAKGIAVAFSVAAVIAFGQESIKAFQEAQLNAKLLESAIVNIGGEGEKAFQKLIDQSAKLQDNSIFSDDDIQKAQTQLVQFGLTSNQVEKLIPQILDLASATGQELGPATDTVIQGINGMTRGLKPLGIEFKNTGDKAENLSIITDKLNKFQGQSQKVLETDTGFVRNLANAYDDAKEKVGQFLSELVTGPQKQYSDQLEEQKSRLNELVFSIEKTNLGDEKRKGLIQDLKREYPDFLKGLDAEKVTNEQLSKRLQDVNKQYLLKISLQRFDEKNADILGDQADAQINLSRATSKLNEEIFKQVDAESLLAIVKANKQNPDDINVLFKTAAAIGSNQGEIQKLVDAYSTYLKASKEFKAADTEANKITTERTNLLKFLEKQYGITAEAEKVASSKLGLTDEEKLKREAAALEAGKKKADADVKILAEKEAGEKAFSEMKAEIDAESSRRAKQQLLEQKADQKFIADAALQDKKDTADASVKYNKEALDKEVDDARRAKDEKALIQQAAFDTGVAAVNGLAQINQNISDQELINLQTQLDKKQITQDQYDQRAKSIKKKAAEDAKLFAIFQTIINTAASIVEASPVIPLMALAAAVGGIQLAVIASQPIPRFEKGTPYLQLGNNKPGKDTILIRANKGEAIIPTERNEERPGLASDWISGNLDKHIHFNYTIPYMKLNRPDPIDYGRLAREIVINQRVFNDRNLLESDRLSREILRDQTGVLKEIVNKRSYPGRY